MPQHAGTPGIRRIAHLREFLVRGRQAVDPGEVRIHEGIVGREELHEVLIVPDQVIEQSPRLLHHRRGDLGVEFAKPPAIARGLQDPVESHPLRQELLHRSPGTGILEHAPRRGFDLLGRRQLSSPGGASSSSLGIVSQRKYERRLAISKGDIGAAASPSRRGRGNAAIGAWPRRPSRPPRGSRCVRPASSRNKAE